MAPTKVMLIRHAEKPDETDDICGVDERGRSDPNQLSVRGWQRAGALVRFFAPSGPGPLPVGIATPSAIIACKPINGSSSLRPYSTVTPLAAELNIEINHSIGKNDDKGLLDALATTSGAVLVCWSHEPIAGIVRGLAKELHEVPVRWPSKRFDLVWILDREGDGWRFSQRGQFVLPGDDIP